MSIPSDPDYPSRNSQNVASIASVDKTGILVVLYIVGSAAFFTTFLGPIGHYLLISPHLLWAKYQRH
jgi:hypothetical protein